MSEKLNLVAYETAFMVCTVQPELADKLIICKNCMQH